MNAGILELDLHGCTVYQAEIALNAAIARITKALTEEEKVQIVGFGAFETKTRAERMGRNPKTGEDIPIPATKVPVFKAGKALKEAVDK